LSRTTGDRRRCWDKAQFAHSLNSEVIFAFEFYRRQRIEFVEEAGKPFFETTLKLRDASEGFDCEGQTNINCATMKEQSFQQRRLSDVVAPSHKINSLEATYAKISEAPEPLGYE
jgi:hypothetical protein